MNESRFPGGAVEYLRGLDPEGNAYNSYEIGGYLMWHRPEKQVFMDGRHLDAQLDLQDRLQSMAAGPLDVFFESLDVQAAMVSTTDGRFARHFRASKGFELVYFDDQALVFVKPESVSADKRASMPGFHFLQPELMDFSYLLRYAKSPMAVQVERELREAVRLSPDSFKARFLAGFFFHARGQNEDALEGYVEAARINPRLAFVHYDVGVRAGTLALAMGRWDDAKELTSAARTYQPEDGELAFLLGTAEYKRGKLAEAESVYLNILSLDPVQVPTLVNLGFLYIDSQRSEDAELMARRALEIDPARPDALYCLALALQRQGRAQESRALWQEFLRRYPESRWAPAARRFLADAPTMHPAPP